jgi:uncharacterized membrane protein YeiH
MKRYLLAGITACAVLAAVPAIGGGEMRQVRDLLADRDSELQQ